MRRCCAQVILAGLLVFRNPITLVNGVASSVAVAGTWFYSRAETAVRSVDGPQ